jgi:hypothetical protein
MYVTKAYYKGQEVKITGFDQVDGTCRILLNDQEIDVPMDDVLTATIDEEK